MARSANKAKEKKVRVRYYACFREEGGCDGESVKTRARTARQLYGQLQQRHKFSVPLDAVKVAVNDRFRSWDVQLRENDTVAFIPPFSGG